MHAEHTSGLIPVATASQPIEATSIQIMLGAHGIESELRGELTVAANPLLSNAIGGIRILVSSADSARAMEILEEHRRLEVEAEAQRARTCPECGKGNGMAVRRPFWIGILILFTLGVFCLLYPWPRYKCPDCGWKWR